LEQFTGTITVRSGSACIVLPFDPDEKWGARTRHHISGSVGGHDYRGEVRREGDAALLRLGPAWLRDTGVAAGEEVEVAVGPEGPQTANMDPDVVAAFQGEDDARAFFEALPTFYRNNLVRWIGEARRPATRAARIAQTVALLRAGRRQT